MTIPTDVAEVLAGTRPWAVACSDNLDLASQLPDKCVDLVFGSPPYLDARTYGIGFAKRGQDWVDWMVSMWRHWQRICRGPVCMVVEGRTEDFAYCPAPYLLAADLYRAGFTLRKPPIYYRHGISGSGGDDWFRNDYEPVVCTTPGGKLAWSNNTACGHPPKWAPGGAMSHRLPDGSRRNQWGGSRRDGTGGGQRRKNGERQKAWRPSWEFPEEPGDEAPDLFGQPAAQEKTETKNGANGYAGGDMAHDREYTPPVLANPGNVIIPPEDSSLIKCKVGGNNMGNKKCHENEAPFPEVLAERFVRSFCPPGGIVFEPFAGSGTTLAVAVRWRRRAVGCDVRQSQVDLTRRRVGEETPMMEGMV